MDAGKPGGTHELAVGDWRPKAQMPALEGERRAAPERLAGRREESDVGVRAWRGEERRAREVTRFTPAAWAGLAPQQAWLSPPFGLV